MDSATPLYEPVYSTLLNSRSTTICRCQNQSINLVSNSWLASIFRLLTSHTKGPPTHPCSSSAAELTHAGASRGTTPLSAARRSAELAATMASLRLRRGSVTGARWWEKAKKHGRATRVLPTLPRLLGAGNLCSVPLRRSRCREGALDCSKNRTSTQACLYRHDHRYLTPLQNVDDVQLLNKLQY